MALKKAHVLWEPTEEIKRKATITQYMNWLNKERGYSLSTYQDVWEWSVQHIDAYWESIWKYFNILHSKPYERIMTGQTMIETEWFSGAEINYAENIFKHAKNNEIAIFSKSELRDLSVINWKTLKDQVASFSVYLRKLGIQPGDRVAAYLPNITETVIAFLATASIGAVWSVCPPEFGVSSTLSRFQQIKPKILITVDGYQYNGIRYEKMMDVNKIISKIPSINQVVVIPYLNQELDISSLPNAISWEKVLKEKGNLHFEQVPFEHPLWILYSSGTTGLPKAIVHSHGGMLLTSLSGQVLQADLRPDDRYFWYTTTGWMLWNTVIGALHAGASIVLYDGSPTYPNESVLWELAENTKMTHFGTSPAYIVNSMKKGIKPKKEFHLPNLRAFAYTGAPLSPEGFRWVYDSVKENVRLIASSGGTDLCGAIVTSSAILPVYAGEIPCRGLGISVYSYNKDGEVIYDEVGEMVITKPTPSMPLYFWGDFENKRYKDSYYNMYPNIWRHGDLLEITNRGTSIIYGRSDATINRGGVRSGSSEIYHVIEIISEVLDSLIIDLSGYNREDLLLFFVVLRENMNLTDGLKEKINRKIRNEVSPRHVPNDILAVSSLPMTMSGKKMEIPVRDILLGRNIAEVINVDAMKNPESIYYFSELAKTLKDRL